MLLNLILKVNHILLLLTQRFKWIARPLEVFLRIKLLHLLQFIGLALGIICWLQCLDSLVIPAEPIHIWLLSTLLCKQVLGRLGVHEHGLDCRELLVCLLLLGRFVSVLVHSAAELAFATVLTSIEQSLRQIDFLLHKFVYAFAPRHHEGPADFVAGVDAAKWLAWFLVEKPIFPRILGIRLGPKTLFGLHLLLSVLPQRWVRFFIRFEGRNATKGVIAITLQTILKFRLSSIPQHVGVLTQVNFGLWLILHELTLLLQGQEVAKKVGVGARN